MLPCISRPEQSSVQSRVYNLDNMDGVKDIHRENRKNTFPNKTLKLTKSMNMNIWVKIKSTVF